MVHRCEPKHTYKIHAKVWLLSAMTTIKAIERELRAKRVVLCRSGRGMYRMFRDADEIGFVSTHTDDRRHWVHLYNPDYFTSIFSIAELRTLILPKLC